MKYFDEFYESLWKNIKDKRDRIARGSGEKMRKPGEKGAPTKDQMDKAKGEGVNLDRENERIAREKAADKKKFTDRRQRARERDQQITQTQQNNSYMENAPSLAVLKKKIKSGTKLGSTETSSAKARGLIPRADGTKRKSPKYK